MLEKFTWNLSIDQDILLVNVHGRMITKKSLGLRNEENKIITLFIYVNNFYVDVLIQTKMNQVKHLMLLCFGFQHL